MAPSYIHTYIQVQSNAAGALHNLAVNDEDAQEAVANAGAIPPLVTLMTNATPDLQVCVHACVCVCVVVTRILLLSRS